MPVSPVFILNGDAMLHRGYRHKRKRRVRSTKHHWLDIVLVIVAAILIGIGSYMLIQDKQAGDNIEVLAEEVGPNSNDDGNTDGYGDSIKWVNILAQNPDTVAWLNVDGTSIDVPVMQTDKSDPEYYLYHDFWGNRSDTGCPFLGVDYDANGQTMQVYGHCTVYNSYMFHDLADKYIQSNFNAIGTAKWATPTSLSTAIFTPICAASVSMYDSNWQIPAKATIQQTRDWAVWACNNASAKADGAEEIAKKADRILVLITCNGWGWHSQTRTAVVFAYTYHQVNDAL